MRRMEEDTNHTVAQVSAKQKQKDHNNETDNITDATLKKGKPRRV